MLREVSWAGTHFLVETLFLSLWEVTSISSLVSRNAKLICALYNWVMWRFIMEVQREHDKYRFLSLDDLCLILWNPCETFNISVNVCLSEYVVDEFPSALLSVRGLAGWYNTARTVSSPNALPSDSLFQSLSVEIVSVVSSGIHSHFRMQSSYFILKSFLSHLKVNHNL